MRTVKNWTLKLNNDVQSKSAVAGARKMTIAADQLTDDSAAPRYFCYSLSRSHGVTARHWYPDIPPP